MRIEAVKALVDIGGPKTVDPLVKRGRDNDPEIQIRATDGLVNVYLPGYIKTGHERHASSASGTSIKAKFGDTNDQVIDAYRAGAAGSDRGARQAGSRRRRTSKRGPMPRARSASCADAPPFPDLIEALHSKDDPVMYEALIAIQKIRDPSAAPRIAFPAARSRREDPDRRARNHRLAAQSGRRAATFATRWLTRGTSRCGARR